MKRPWWEGDHLDAKGRAFLAEFIISDPAARAHIFASQVADLSQPRGPGRRAVVEVRCKRCKKLLAQVEDNPYGLLLIAISRVPAAPEVALARDGKSAYLRDVDLLDFENPHGDHRPPVEVRCRHHGSHGLDRDELLKAARRAKREGARRVKSA
ncbi:MAG: hypothetical protein ACRDZ1_16765 [Acidimicrobiia bacterium]